MGGLPDVIVVIDTNKEHIAIAEANTLNIPVVGILDSNSSPDNITYPIPGNDDAIRAISLYCDLMAESVLDGIQQELSASGTDIGAAEEAPVETLPEAAAEAPAAEAPAAEAAAAAPAAEAPAAEAAPEAEAAPAAEAPAAEAEKKAEPEQAAQA